MRRKRKRVAAVTVAVVAIGLLTAIGIAQAQEATPQGQGGYPTKAAAAGYGNPHSEVREAFRVRFGPEAPLVVASTSFATATLVLSDALPAGSWLLTVQVDAGRATGGGGLLCATLLAEVPGFAYTITRAWLGDEPGFVREATMTGTGAVEVGPDGGTLEVRCWQPFGVSGPPANVFLAIVDAQRVTAITSVEQE